MPRPDKRSGPATGPLRSGTTTSTAILPDWGDQHCPRCVCRCRCHKPRPEPPYVPAPPEPGSPFFSAWLAEGRAA